MNLPPDRYHTKANTELEENKFENFNYLNVATSLPCGTECEHGRPQDSSQRPRKMDVWIWLSPWFSTVEPQLSEPHGRHTIRPDNRGVRIDEGNRNSRSMGYRVGDN